VSATKNPILDLLFAGQNVRLVPREPEPWLVGVDVCRVLGLESPRERLNRLPEKWRAAVTIRDASSSRKSGQRKTQNAVIIAPAGAMYLAFRSGKPEAQAFADWLLEEVLPQIAKFGVYVAGTEPAERCKLLWHRWRHERAKEIAAANAELEAKGLVTIALFAELNRVELRDLLGFARLACAESMKAGEKRARVYTKGGMRRAYSDRVLRAALARLQPQLPFPEDATPGLPADAISPPPGVRGTEGGGA
jgi:prophage antirepressor-like protein